MAKAKKILKHNNVLFNRVLDEHSYIFINNNHPMNSTIFTMSQIIETLKLVSKICDKDGEFGVLHTANVIEEDFNSWLLKKENEHSKFQSIKFIDIKNKEEYLKAHYPFSDLPKLTDKKLCIHCDKSFLVGDYKVEFSNGEEYIVCPNAPDCNGTVIDWVNVKK